MARSWKRRQRSIRPDEVMVASAEQAVSRAIRAGADLYERERDLPKLIRLDTPGSEPAPCLRDTEAIVARLECALRAERQRAGAGYWAYDLNRHIALRQALLAESERLCALRRR